MKPGADKIMIQENKINPESPRDIPDKEEDQLYEEVLRRRKAGLKANAMMRDLFEGMEEKEEGTMKNKQGTGQKIYTFEEALQASTEYFKGDAMAANVWVSKYALKDSENKIYELTPDDMHWRIANEIARIEARYPHPMNKEEIYELLKQFRYIIPQGSPMAGIGNNIQLGSLSNCFVIGQEKPADSYGGIMRIDQEQVQLMKRRGGVGHDLSHIRPKGSPVKNTALSSTGIVPFMERYSNSTREVAQDGRRGALMLTISVKHPDVEDFIDAKLEAGKVTGANISVKLTDEFMEAVKNNREYVHQFPIDAEKPSFTKTVYARQLWDKIIHNAWKSAEPGILFWDTIIRESIPDCYADYGFRTISTNPCGEIPLCPYDSCRLMSINLYSYVENPFTPQAFFNAELFTVHVRKAQRIMDDIIDLELEKIDRILEKITQDPEDEETKRIERLLWENIRHKAVLGRRTGLGITAEGDMLAALGYRYGSDEAINFCVAVQRTLALEAYRSSVEMAVERGPFEIYDSQREENNPFILRLKEADEELYHNMVKHGRRNVSLLTVAPTGSVSILTQTSSGIEPVFAVRYKRRRKINPSGFPVSKISYTDISGDSWEEYNVFHHGFIRYLQVKGYNPDEVLQLSDKEIDKLIEDSPYYNSTANDIDWVAKVRMQGNIQKWVDHSISVTVNVPAETSEELVSKIYLTAWESGCKGVTIYREGSREGVLIKEKKEEEMVIHENNAPRRPKVLEASVVRFLNGSEEWVAVVGIYNGRPYEIFTGKAEGFYAPQWVTHGWVIKNRQPDGKARYDFQFEDKDGYRTTMEGLSRMFDAEYWNYAKLISGILRHGMPLTSVIDLVSKLRLDSDSINSWKTGVERALKQFIPNGTKVAKATCEKCGQTGTLQYQEGCLICTSCGYSKCG